MKFLIFSILIFLLFGCSSNKEVYWCGDHACVNKKEKEIYFKETMIVEKRKISEKSSLSKSEKDDIIEQIHNKEKKFSRRDKKLKKQARSEEKQIMGEVKAVKNKNIALDQKECFNWNVEKRSLRECLNPILGNRKSKLDKKNQKDITLLKKDESLFEFVDLVKKITMKNKSKPYPNINEILD